MYCHLFQAKQRNFQNEDKSDIQRKNSLGVKNTSLFFHFLRFSSRVRKSFGWLSSGCPPPHLQISQHNILRTCWSRLDYEWATLWLVLCRVQGLGGGGDNQSCSYSMFYDICGCAVQCLYLCLSVSACSCVWPVCKLAYIQLQTHVDISFIWSILLTSFKLISRQSSTIRTDALQQASTTGINHEHERLRLVVWRQRKIRETTLVWPVCSEHYIH